MSVVKHVKEYPYRYALLLGIAIFAFLKLLFLDRYHLIIWDEAVYLTMGKFLISGGQLGYWEILRPPILPAILAGLQLLGDPVVLGELLMGVVAITGSVLLYQLLKKHVSPWIAAGVALLLLFTPIWFTWSNRILTGVLSATIILAAGYAYAEKRHALAAILSALAFLTRFPAGMILAACGITYVVLTLREWYNARRPIWGARTKDMVIYASVSIGILLVWVLINWFSWHAETAVWWHAAFRPLIMGGGNVFLENLWLYDASYLFYIKSFLITIPVTLLAIPGLYALRKHPRLIPVSLSGIFGLVFFTILPHNELRFALITLPGIFVLTALGASWVAKKPFAKAVAIVSVLLFANVAAVMVADGVTVNTWSHEPPEIVQFYTFLKQHPVSGTIIVSDPVVAWYAPNRIIPAYYDPYLLERVLVQEHSAIAFSPGHFPCPPEDTTCEESVKQSIDRITTNQRLVYKQEFQGEKYYIFSDETWFEPIPTDELRSAYGLADPIVLSRFPHDVLPVTFILEDFPSLDDTGQALWEADRYEAVLAVFNDTPATAAVIPTHLKPLATVRPWVVQELSRFSIAQNGYDHSTLPGREQEEEIRLGKQVIMDVFDMTPQVFIPPLYVADEDTAKALTENGFSVYVSTPGDPVVVEQTRLDQTNSLIRNWEENIHKTPRAVLDDLSALARYDDYAMMSVYYFMYDEEQVAELSEIVEAIEDRYVVMTAEELASWVAAQQETTVTVSGASVRIDAPLGVEGVTLLVRRSGNWSIESAIPISIKNVGEQDVTICVDSCDTISPNHFFLSMSDIVMPPPDAVLEKLP